MNSKKIYLLFFPALALLAIVFFVPLIFLLVKSFQTYIPGSLFTNPKITMDNYSKVITDTYNLSIYFRTLSIAIISTVIVFVLAFPISIWISNLNKSLRGFVVTLVILPMIGGAMIQTMGWFTVLMNYGTLNTILRGLGIINKPIQFLGNQSGVIIGLVQAFLPFMILPLVSSLTSIDSEVIESARTLGAKPMVLFTKIILPLSWPGASAGSILVFMACLTSYVTPSTLGQGKVQIFGTYVYQQAMLVMNWPFSSAFAIIFMILMAILVFVLSRILKGVGINE